MQLDIFATFVASVASILVGFVWFNKFVFGKLWMKELGWSKAEAKKRQKLVAPAHLIGYLSSIVIAIALFNAMQVFEVESIGQACKIAIFAWLGFYVPTSFSSAMYSGMKKKLWLINSGYWLAVFLIEAAVLFLI